METKVLTKKRGEAGFKSQGMQRSMMKGGSKNLKRHEEKKKTEMSQAELRGEFRKIIQMSLPNFQQWINEIEDPKDKCEMFLKLSKFVIPTLNSVENDITLSIKPFAAELAELTAEEQ